MDKVRVIRVLEYEGTRDWVEKTLAADAIKGTRNFGNGCVLREATVGDFPEIVEEEKKTRVVEQLTPTEIKFMKRFGWDLSTKPAIKYAIQTSQILAHEGDETWIWDLKVAGE